MFVKKSDVYLGKKNYRIYQLDLLLGESYLRSQYRLFCYLEEGSIYFSIGKLSTVIASNLAQPDIGKRMGSWADFKKLIGFAELRRDNFGQYMVKNENRYHKVVMLTSRSAHPLTLSEDNKAEIQEVLKSWLAILLNDGDGNKAIADLPKLQYLMV